MNIIKSSVLMLAASAIVGLNSCSFNPDAESTFLTYDGFYVDPETTSLIVSSALLKKSESYYDDLVKICDELNCLSDDDIITADEFKKSVQKAIISSSAKRKTAILVAFDVLFNYYKNAFNQTDMFDAKKSAATIKSIANGILRSLDVYSASNGEVMESCK